MRCNVCDAPLGDPLFESQTETALTSLCEVRDGRTRVWQCQSCSHLRGEAFEDNDAYYESNYRILINTDEEDQIYEVRDGQIVYRTEHQAKTMLDKLSPRDGARLLDYGCAKASTPRLLANRGSDIEFHVFDVSAMYQPFWDKFVPAERQATYRTPAHWKKNFDIVTSFFALEHIPEPLSTARHIADLLKDDGVFYGIVPDTFSNPADFIVIDHVNHFTRASLDMLLRKAGFVHIDVDANAHRGALVVMARKQGTVNKPPSVEPTLDRSSGLADYWGSLGKSLRETEIGVGPVRAAIYGSGFYGAFIASELADHEQVLCFLDCSPYQQGKTLFGKPIVAPEEMPPDVEALYIGLNPAIARETVAQMSWLAERNVRILFLDLD